MTQFDDEQKENEQVGYEQAESEEVEIEPHKQIGNYYRYFKLAGGPLVQTISIISASILFVFGIIEWWDLEETIILVIYTAASASVLLTGYVISKLLNIQNAKLELMEMQTEHMLKEKNLESDNLV